MLKMRPLRKYPHLFFIILSLLILFSSNAYAGFLNRLLESLGIISSREAPTEIRIAEGLREALSVASVNAVKTAGKTDGYFSNRLVKILLPESISRYEKGIRILGYGNELDSFIVSMNRAAEKAAVHAVPIFSDAIKSITFDDARRLLSGGDTAITDFFRDKTFENLYQAFMPAVENELSNFDVTDKYQSVAKAYMSVPVSGKPELPVLGEYVTSRALEGLFLIMSHEETNIRKNPSARVTDLLKEVFGKGR